jgi:alcohol dehydrogenase class IV
MLAPARTSRLRGGRAVAVISCLTTVWFDFGAVDRLGEALDQLAIRRVAGLRPGADLSEWIRGLNRRLGLPASLRAMGVVEADLEGLAERAERDHCNATNPRPATAADYARLYREALA